MRLSHFSDDPDIEVFNPRPVRVPVNRPPGHEWLNGALVWAIDEPHSILYLFPRECPRILIWPTSISTDEDCAAWMGTTTARAVAYIETAWLQQLYGAAVYRYDLPVETFEDTGEVGMWVSRSAVRPYWTEPLGDLAERLREANVELRTLDRLTGLKPVWRSTLHASGIRLRNALDWGPPGWPHSSAGLSVSILGDRREA